VPEGRPFRHAGIRRGWRLSGRAASSNPEDFLIPFRGPGSTGRPVKWIEDRSRETCWPPTTPGRTPSASWRIACPPRDGTHSGACAVQGLHGSGCPILRTVGATASRNIAAGDVGALPYSANIHIDVSLVDDQTRTPLGHLSGGPGRFEESRFFPRAAHRYRGNGSSEQSMAVRVPAAAQSDLGSRDGRIRFAKDPGARTSRPSATAVTMVARLDRCLPWPKSVWGRESRPARTVDRWPAYQRGLAIGCLHYIEGGASGPKGNLRGLKLEPDGSVSVFVGSSSVGQGIETVLRPDSPPNASRNPPWTGFKGRYFTASNDHVSERIRPPTARGPPVHWAGSAIVLAAAGACARRSGRRRPKTLGLRGR